MLNLRAAAVIVALLCADSKSIQQTPKSVGDRSVSHPFQGVTHTVISTSAPRPIRAHVVQIDLSTPGVRVKLTPPNGDRETVRQTTAEFTAAEHAQVGINAHFFLPFPSTDTSAWLIGLAASDGRVYSACEMPEQNYAIVANAPAINIDRSNHASIVHCDASSTDPKRVRENAELWTTITGSAQIAANGVVTVPAYRDDAHPGAVLAAGGPRAYDNTKSWYDIVTARSAIGISADGKMLTLFTVDAKGGSDGMSVKEVAAWLVADFGVFDALNIDGGGSTSLAMADPETGAVSLVNASSDNPKGRSVGSSLVVFAPTTKR